jgi:hypothetical protein
VEPTPSKTRRLAVWLSLVAVILPFHCQSDRSSVECSPPSVPGYVQVHLQYACCKQQLPSELPRAMASRDLTQAFVDRRNSAIRKRAKEQGGGGLGSSGGTYALASSLSMEIRQDEREDACALVLGVPLCWECCLLCFVECLSLCCAILLLHFTRARLEYSSTHGSLSSSSLLTDCMPLPAYLLSCYPLVLYLDTWTDLLCTITHLRL